ATTGASTATAVSTSWPRAPGRANRQTIVRRARQARRRLLTRQNSSLHSNTTAWQTRSFIRRLLGPLKSNRETLAGMLGRRPKYIDLLSSRKPLTRHCHSFIRKSCRIKCSTAFRRFSSPMRISNACLPDSVPRPVHCHPGSDRQPVLQALSSRLPFRSLSLSLRPSLLVRHQRKYSCRYPGGDLRFRSSARNPGFAVKTPLANQVTEMPTLQALRRLLPVRRHPLSWGVKYISFPP